MTMFGAKKINMDLPKWSKQALSEQKMMFPASMKTLEKHGMFNVNWALTADPKIEHKTLDLEFLMDIGPEQNQCSLPKVIHNYDFLKYDPRYY